MLSSRSEIMQFCITSQKKPSFIERWVLEKRFSLKSVRRAIKMIYCFSRVLHRILGVFFSTISRQPMTRRRRSRTLNNGHSFVYENNRPFARSICQFIIPKMSSANKRVTISELIIILDANADLHFLNENSPIHCYGLCVNCVIYWTKKKKKPNKINPWCPEKNSIKCRLFKFE